MYPELQTISDQLEEVNIIILPGGGRAGYPIEFDGTEDEFVNALELFMMTNGYCKQDDDWFPGDPGDLGEKEYYIMNDDVQFCISYDDKLMSELV